MMLYLYFNSGLEGTKRNYGLVKAPSFNDKLNGSNSSLGSKINPASEVKQIAAPTAMKNDRSEARESRSSDTAKKPAVLYRVRALYDFKAETADDLDFTKGEIISVVSQVDDSWLAGEIVDDDGTVRKGIFPANYVEKIASGSAANGEKPKEAKQSAETAQEESGLPNSMAISQEAMSQMKSVLPGAGSIADISAAITSVKLKSSGPKKQAPTAAAPEPVVAAVGECSTCGCDDFHPNAFKKGQCNMCFHKH